MSQTSGVAKKFRVHLVVEAVLVVALMVYLILGKNQVVGDDLAFTVTGVGLMVLVSFWTLNTVRKMLELAANRMRPLHH